jgi:hypothetical protein
MSWPFLHVITGMQSAPSWVLQRQRNGITPERNVGTLRSILVIVNQISLANLLETFYLCHVGLPPQIVTEL